MNHTRPRCARLHGYENLRRGCLPLSMPSGFHLTKSGWHADRMSVAGRLMSRQIERGG
jgi:hypothetical protein